MTTPRFNPGEWLRNALFKKELDTRDGSEELAKEWLDLLDGQEELQSLLQNKAFKQMLDGMTRDFKSRMHELVMKDPELLAIKKMFIRTVGLRDAEAQITKQVVEYLQEEADVTPPPAA